MFAEKLPALVAGAVESGVAVVGVFFQRLEKGRIQCVDVVGSGGVNQLAVVVFLLLR